MDREQELMEELKEISCLNLPTIQVTAWATNEMNDWHKLDRTFGDWASNIHREISEAFEIRRNGYPTDAVFVGDQEIDTKKTLMPEGKPEGVPVELADAVIWILDYCQENEIPLAKIMGQKLMYNLQRESLHGGKIK